MALNEALQESLYLISSYSEAKEQWDKFKQTNNRTHLRSALRILCETHRRLEDDSVFWLELQKLPMRTIRYQDKLRPLLTELVDLLKIEYEIATNLKSKKEAALACVVDMIVAAEIVEKYPDRITIENLRARSVEMTKIICGVYEKVDVDLVRVIRITFKSLLFICGAGTVALNTMSAIESAPALASVILGVQLMEKQIPDRNKETE